MSRRRELSVDDPQAYLAADRRLALLEGRELPDRVVGAGLFADLAGFTPLTEALVNELGPHRGAEELAATLDDVFGELLADIHRYGGVVVYFSGDALTCWFDGDDGLGAVAAGLGMLDTLERLGTRQTPGGTEITLGIKVAVSVGAARRFVVGRPDIQLIDALAGTLTDRLAATERHAESGEVMIDLDARAALGSRVLLGEIRGEYVVVDGLAGPPPPPRPLPEPGLLPEEIVRQWVPPQVYQRVRSGRSEFLADLRPGVPLFLLFGGIDFDDDPRAAAKLDEFVGLAQEIVDANGGSVMQLTIGDKGAYLFAMFGAPVAHEDNATRACATAIRLLALEGETAATGLRIGIAQGRLRSGTYGGRNRRTFTCLGDAVNTAARLMSFAAPGQALVSEQAALETGTGFDWEQLPGLKLKGKSERLPTRRLVGRAIRRSPEPPTNSLPLIGRRSELRQLRELRELAFQGAGQVVGLRGDAGIGKSRVLEELLGRVAGSARVFRGDAQRFGALTAYAAWQGIWQDALGVDPTQLEAHEQVRRAVELIDPALVDRSPLLSSALGVSMADTDLTAGFDAKLRKSSLEDLLRQLLVGLAARGPMVIVLEDAHALDPLSVALLEVIARAVATLPVLVLTAYRPADATGKDAGGGDLGLTRLPHWHEIGLGDLGPEDCAELVAAKLRSLTGDPVVPLEVVALLTQRSQGNPFYLEELIAFLVGAGVDVGDVASVRALELPASLSSLVLSRIDTLAEEQRRTLAVASVVGRAFREPVLTGAYPELGRDDDVFGHLAVMTSSDLVLVESVIDRAYLFKHIVTQEVTYNSLPFSSRSLLHGRVAAFLEQSDPDGVEVRLELLAHHYWHAEDEAKKREFLLRAGEAAAARYANDAALQHFRRVEPLLPERERGPVLAKLGAVLEVTGEWAEAERVYRRAVQLAVTLGDPVGAAVATTSLAEVTRLQGRYAEAGAHLSEAQTTFAGLPDRRGLAGLGRVLHLRGTLAAQQGDLPNAREHYRSSLVIREELGDNLAAGALLSNMAIVEEYDGNLAEAEELAIHGLDLRERTGDRRAIGISQNNLGMLALLRGDFAGARERFEATVRINIEVGDPWMTALGHNGLGNALLSLGLPAEARASFGLALTLQRQLHDRWALAPLFEDLIPLATAAGEYAKALTLAGGALALREELGSPRGPALERQVEAELVVARSALGSSATWLIEAGRKLPLAEIVELAASICVDPP